MCLGFKECACEVNMIPDFEIREKLVQISQCLNEDEYATILASFPDRMSFGSLQLNPLFSQRSKMVKMICHHCIISRNMEEISAFMDGLECNGILQLIRKYSEDAIKMLTFHSDLITAETVKTIFMVNYSTNEELRALEEDIYFNWANFIDEVENQSVVVEHISVSCLDEGLKEHPQMEKKTIKLTDIVQFLTGKIFIYLKRTKER